MLGQLELAGCEVCEPQQADILLYVNNFIDHQGEIVMKVNTVPYNKNFSIPSQAYMIGDVRFANGADNAFVKKLFENDFGENFYGYSAWNTSANSLGSLICAAIVKFYAKNFDDLAFKKLQLVRFLDDWAYQANVRQEIVNPDVSIVTGKMRVYENLLCAKLGIKDVNLSYSFPWQRLFEIEVNVD